MICNRVLLSFSLHRLKSLCLQRPGVVKGLQVCNQHSKFPNRCIQVKNVRTTGTPVQTSAAGVMQPANTSYGGEANAVASDGEDDDEEGCAAGGTEALVDVESRMQQDKMITTGQAEAISMELHRRIADAETCTVLTPTEPNEKKSKRKLRRERLKLMKKKLKSAKASASLMSELPFALTSPTTWKELGFPTLETSEKKRKRKRRDSGGRMESEEDGDLKKKKKKSQRPNYFVSIPITNTEIKALVKEVQEGVLQQEPRLAKAMIPVPTLHITLLVTHLASQEQVELAAAALAQVEPSVAELLGGRDLVLPFSGIRHFRKEVVFVGLDGGEHRHTLDSLAESLRRRFEEQGLLQGDCRDFEPHLTIMKLSRASKLRFQGIKRVEPGLYSDYTNKFFWKPGGGAFGFVFYVKKEAKRRILPHRDFITTRVGSQFKLCQAFKRRHVKGQPSETGLSGRPNTKDGVGGLCFLDNCGAKAFPDIKRRLKSGGRRRSEPDEAELLKVSKRLVEDAISRALQQYKQETLQNGAGPTLQRSSRLEMRGDEDGHYSQLLHGQQEVTSLHGGKQTLNNRWPRTDQPGLAKHWGGQ